MEAEFAFSSFCSGLLKRLPQPTGVGGKLTMERSGLRSLTKGFGLNQRLTPSRYLLLRTRQGGDRFGSTAVKRYLASTKGMHARARQERTVNRECATGASCLPPSLGTHSQSIDDTESERIRMPEFLTAG